MKKIENKTHIEGRIHESKLENKVSQKGVPYIGGILSIATDERATNIIKVKYTYEPEKTAKGNNNTKYPVLKQILESGKTILKDGFDVATKVKIDSAIGVNDYYVEENKDWKLISGQENSGGFIHIVSELNKDEALRDTFKCDMVITRKFLKEGLDDAPSTMRLDGCTFDFAGNLLPVSFIVTNPNGVAYIDDHLDLDEHPVFTSVWGRQVNTSVETKVETESAFGEKLVEVTTKTTREWVATGLSTVSYDWDDESTITAAEVKTANENRKVKLAEILQGAIKRKEDKAKGNTGANNAFTAAGGASDFNF